MLKKINSAIPVTLEYDGNICGEACECLEGPFLDWHGCRHANCRRLFPHSISLELQEGSDTMFMRSQKCIEHTNRLEELERLEIERKKND